MAAEHVTVLVDDGAATGRAGRLPIEERRVIVIGDETDLLAVRLVRHRQLALSRVIAHRMLRPVADRKDGARQLLLRQ